MAHHTDLHRSLALLIEEFRSSHLPITQKLLNLQEFTNKVEKLSPQLPPEDIDDLLETIEAIDFPSKRLKLELANRFKRPLIILEYIKTEEKLLAKRALHFEWMFYGQSSPLTNPKTLVRIILPGLSYLTRSKIIRLLSMHLNDEQKCEELFELIEKKFGSFSALQLISSCSVPFIKRILEWQPAIVFLFDMRQSLKIAKKDYQTGLNFLKVIFRFVKSHEFQKTQDSNSNSPSITDLKSEEVQLATKLRDVHYKTLEYLCVTHPQEFLGLYEEYSKEIGGTWLNPKPNTTKALLSSPFCKTAVLNDVPKFKSILIPHVVKRLLSSEEFTTFFKGLLPESIEHFVIHHEHLFEKWLKEVPSKHRWVTLSQAFLSKYGKNITDFPEYISPLVMKIMPQDIREKWALIQLQRRDPGKTNYAYWTTPQGHLDGFWYSFLPIEKSLPEIKKLLQHESNMGTRCDLVKYLVTSCFINQKDVKSLVQVCKYVLARYRNDSKEIRQILLSEIGDSFKLKNLLGAKELWEVLEELIKLGSVYKEPENHAILEGALRHKLFCSLPTDSLENNFKKATDDNSGYWIGDTYGMWRGYPIFLKLEDQYLKSYLNFLSKWYPVESATADYSQTQIKNVIRCLIDKILDLRRQHGKYFKNNFNLINYPWLGTMLTELSKLNGVDIYRYEDLWHSSVTPLIRTNKELMSSFFSTSLKSTPYPEIILYYLRSNPSGILQNIESIIEFILTSEDRVFKYYKCFFITLKTQGFIEISSAFVEASLEVAQDDTEDEKSRRHALIILSYLWDSNNYLNSLSLFYPTSPTIDLTDENFESQFPVKKTVIMSLSHLPYGNKCLAPIGKFCIGDYLKAAVGPLQSICLYSPQLEAIKFLKEDLLDSPVSVKKHAIHLLCRISEQDEVEELLSYLWENEAHPSIREVVMAKWCFLLVTSSNKKSEKVAKSIKEAVLSLSGLGDKGVLTGLLKPSILELMSPKTFFQYVEAYYTALSKVKIDKDMEPVFVYFVQKVVQHISILMNENLIHSILTKYFLELGESPEVTKIISSLASAALFTPNQLENNVLNLITQKLTKLSTKEQWNYTKVATVKRSIKSDMCDSAEVDCEIATYPSKVALTHFVTEICREMMRSRILGRVPSSNADSPLSIVLEVVKSKFDAAETFTERIYLNLAKFFEKEWKSGVKVKMDRIDDHSLLELGKQIRHLTDEITDEFSPLILSLYCDTLATFLEDICIPSVPSLVNFIHLLVGLTTQEGEATSDDNVIVACHFLPRFAPKTPELEKKYLELNDKIKLHPSKAIQAMLCSKFKQDEKMVIRRN